MSAEDCARALLGDAAFNAKLVALAEMGDMASALALVRRSIAPLLGREPTVQEMIDVGRASIALLNGRSN